MSEKQLNEEVQAIKDAILASKPKWEDGKFEDKDHYLNGLTKEQQESIAFTKAHDEAFIAGAAAAVGELAVKEFEKNSAVDRLEAKFKTVGRDHVMVRVDRRSESVNPRNREEKIVKYGKLTIDHRRQASNKNAGQLGIVQQQLHESAATKLAKDALANA
jgi:hypothetical protein